MKRRTRRIVVETRKLRLLPLTVRQAATLRALLTQMDPQYVAEWLSNWRFHEKRNDGAAVSDLRARAELRRAKLLDDRGCLTIHGIAWAVAASHQHFELEDLRRKRELADELRRIMFARGRTVKQRFQVVVSQFECKASASYA